MFFAKVYRIAIPSGRTFLKEDRIAREIISRWSNQFGEKNGVVFLPIPIDGTDVVPDICIFNVDNYVEAEKVESAIASGTRVMLFFRQSHDSGNTIPGELKEVEEFRKKVLECYQCHDYKDSLDYQNVLVDCLERFLKLL